MSHKPTNNQQGFTIIELMIATVVFSIILLAAAASLVQIGRLYYKGVNSSRTQSVARTVMDDVSRPIQFAGQDPKVAGLVDINGIKTGVFCIGNQRYTYGLNAQVTDDSSINGSYNSSGTHKARHAFWQDTISDPGAECVPVDLTADTPQPLAPKNVAPFLGSAGKELLSQNMRLKDFTIVKANNLWNISVKIIYGDDDLITFDALGQPERCSGNAGDQWCALSELSTQVTERIQ